MKRVIRISILFAAAFIFFLFSGTGTYASGDRTEGEYSVNLWYSYWNYNSSIYVPQRGTFAEPKTIRLKYGSKTITAQTTASGELPANIYLGDETGWGNGTKIQLLDIPAPDGYELCFKQQPTISIDTGMYAKNNTDPTHKNIDVMISVKKAGEKTDFSSTLLNTIYTESDGTLTYKYTGSEIKPPCEVYLNTIPLREGIDYKVSYEDNVQMGTAHTVITGMGEFTGVSKHIFQIGDSGYEFPAAGSQQPAYGVGSVFIKNNIKYKITSASAIGKLKVTGLKNKNKTTIKIPNVVTVNGKKYRVTAIAANAFKNAKASSAVIGAYVKVIGKNAFYGCKKLKKITVKSKYLTLSRTGKNAFKGIYKKAVFKTGLSKSKRKAYRKIFIKRGASGKIRVLA